MEARESLFSQKRASERAPRGALGIVSAAARLASRINFIENRPLAREPLPSSRSLIFAIVATRVVDAMHARVAIKRVNDTSAYIYVRLNNVIRFLGLDLIGRNRAPREKRSGSISRYKIGPR